MTIDKTATRRILRRRRMAIDRATRRVAERHISGYLKPLLKRGKRLAVYVPAGSELRLDGLVAAAQQRGVKLYVPEIEKGKRRLWFAPLDMAIAPTGYLKRSTRQVHFSLRQLHQQGQFKPNARLICGQGYVQRATACRRIRAHRLQAIVVPLIGIDPTGIRMGQGGGFYDSSLAVRHHLVSPVKIGAGFACQMCDNLPVEKHDVRLDVWVCETGVVDFRAPAK